VLEELDRPRPGRWERADLIVLAVHHQDWNIDECKIVIELGFGQDLDALIVGRDGTHHSLPPPILPNPFGNDRARTIEAVERHCDVFIKLRAVVRRSRADLVDHLFRDSVGVPG